MNIAVFGGVYVDIFNKVPRIPKQNEFAISSAFKMALGGKASNAAVALARLDESVCIVGQTGNDALGSLAAQTFSNEGVGTAYLGIHPTLPTDTVMVTVDDEAKSSIIVHEGINVGIRWSAVAPIFAAFDAGALALDAVYLTLEPLPIVARVVREAAARGIFVFCDGGPHSREFPMKALQYIDVIAPNATEAERLTGVTVHDARTAAKAAHKLLERGAKAVLITLGVHGAYWRDHNGEITVAGKAVNTVDEIGAGDAFRAAFLSDFLAHRDVKHALETASCAGALATTRFGGYDTMPTRAELAAFSTGQSAILPT